MDPPTASPIMAGPIRMPVRPAPTGTSPPAATASCSRRFEPGMRGESALRQFGQIDAVAIGQESGTAGHDLLACREAALDRDHAVLAQPGFDHPLGHLV